MIKVATRVRVMLSAVLATVALCYLPGLSGGFAFDDFPNIVDNKALQVTFDSSWRQWLAAMFSSPASQMQRPLAMLSFALNIAGSGLDPYWIKITNVGIHLLNTVLVFALVQQLLHAADRGKSPVTSSRYDWMAIWIAAAWALNPINVMAVLFAVQRMESLCHTFVFAGLWLYMAGRRRLLEEGRGWPALLIGLVGGTALGMMVKESAALLPMYALVLEWSLLKFASHGHTRDRRLLGLFAAVVLLPAAAGLTWLLPKVLESSAFAGRPFSLGGRLLTEPSVVLQYLHWTVLPDLRQLSLYHDDYPVSESLLSPPTTLAAILILAGLVVVTIRLRRRRPLTALGLAWFLAAQLLTATVIPLDLMYEHRNYFASLGLCIALADVLLRMPRNQTLRRGGLAMAMLMIVMFGGVTALRAAEWDDPLRFAKIEAARHPQSPRATYAVARQLVILSGYRTDSPYFEQARAALDRAMRVPGASILPETALIFMASRSGQPLDDAWWTSLQIKLGSRPIGPQETSALASLVGCAINRLCPLPRQPMVDSFTAALAHGPNAEIMNIYGNYALNMLDEPDRALSLWRQAADLSPGVVQYQITLSKMLIATDRLDEVAQHIAGIRKLGRVGQNEQAAKALDRLLAQARAARAAPPDPSRSQESLRQ